MAAITPLANRRERNAGFGDFSVIINVAINQMFSIIYLFGAHYSV